MNGDDGRETTEACEHRFIAGVSMDSAPPIVTSWCERCDAAQRVEWFSQASDGALVEDYPLNDGSWGRFRYVITEATA